MEREHREQYVGASFFLLPTPSECNGAVFCEAAAFALPMITTDTGGVSEIVKNRENGYLLAPSANGGEYARAIGEAWAEKEKYMELQRNSRASFERRLNWDVWGTTVGKLVGALLQKRRMNIEAAPELSTWRPQVATLTRSRTAGAVLPRAPFIFPIGSMTHSNGLS